MRRVSHNNTEFTEIFSEFSNRIRNFTTTKLDGYRIDILYRSQDLDYIYADVIVDGRGELHIRIDYRYRNKQFRIDTPYHITDEAKKKYINLALKAIEEKTGWRRIGPDE